MRVAVLCLGLVCLAHEAQGADLLRGSMVEDDVAPISYTRWEGIYIGATGGYNASGADFSDAARSQIAYILRESALETMGHVSQWKMLGKQDSSASSYGGFIGYNRQWDDAVIGIEVNYNRTSINNGMADTLSRIVTPGDGYRYDTTIDASARMHITDYGSLRLRAGYGFGRVMPYAILGVAAGRADIERTTTVSAQISNLDGSNPYSFGPVTQREAKATYLFGYAAGLGLDVALSRNIFLRGEWEYIQFGVFSDMKANLNTVRFGAGLKF